MSIRKLENGKWQARVSVKVDGEYKIKKKTAKSKYIVEDFEKEWKQKERSGMALDKQDITVPEYMREFIDLYKSGKSDRTLEIYEGSYKKIKGSFYGKKLVALTRSDVQRFMNEFGEKHAITTSKKLFQHLHQTVTSAINDGIIARDVCAHIEVTGSDPIAADKKFLEYEDYQVLIDYLFKNAEYSKLYMELALFALQSGCRFSEISGVKIDDLNFRKNTVTISRQWMERQAKSAPTKGNGKADRIIALSRPYMDHLDELIDQRHRMLLSNDIVEDDGYLFLTNEGKHIKNDSCNKSLHELCKQLDIKRVNMHGMRHTHATLLIYRHRDPWYIAKRLGHQSIKQLDRTYGHVFGKMSAENDEFVMADFGNDLIHSNQNKVISIKK
ncbi:site-specific integrase [Latilactobacillus curvatus]|uniref:tyrosine-type recombinase/integrase n=1 Tax=Latilactobacillus curvatus TaxID=28038 RepID=UPI0020C78048|nr:site-specific integrase [Latilactobacillus curvatus]MCP8849141.1 site-specific integrase [Latilactobacillus curvatus]